MLRMYVVKAAGKLTVKLKEMHNAVCLPPAQRAVNQSVHSYLQVTNQHGAQDLA